MQINATDPRSRPSAPWTVQPHGDLVALDDGVWTVSGTIHMPIGLFPRRMTVVRLEGGRLVIYSGIALDQAALDELETFGVPTFLVVPNDHHREDALAWKQRFPALQVIAPAGSLERIEAKVPVDTTTPRFDDPEVIPLLVPGTQDHEMALLVRRPAGTTLIVNDIISNIRGAQGFNGWLLKLMGFAGDHPQVPAPVKAMMIKEKAALRQQLLDWSALSDLRRIVIAHGDIIDRDPQGALRLLAETLE
jgi:hypothetical protein